MQDIDSEEVNEVSGGNMIISAIVGWAVGKILDAGASGIAAVTRGGGEQDYSRTTAMGDCY